MFVVLPIDIVIGDYNFIDCNLINEQIISSEETQHSSRFRSQIMERDGSVCIFTGGKASICQAAHLLPRSKGDKVSIQYHCFISTS